MITTHRIAVLVATLTFVGLIALGARVDVAVPGSPVPQSLQTLAVLAAGLALGWAGLSLRIGASGALLAGVTPFLWGMAVKSAALSLIAPLLTRLRDRLNI